MKYQILFWITFLFLYAMTVCATYTHTKLENAETRIQLLEQNRVLHRQLTFTTLRYCAVQGKLGEAYRMTLKNLMDRLGLHDPTSIAVLEAYHATAIGGGEEDEESGTVDASSEGH